MIALAVFLFIVAGLFFLGGFGHLIAIGVPREPVTVAEGVSHFIFRLLYALLFILSGIALINAAHS